jgi:hypothetical protein
VDTAPNPPAFASVGEAMDTAHAALSYLAAADADAAQLAARTQAECLRGLERTDAIITAARASFLSAFTVGKGYSADADYSARAWLMHKTGITRGAAASHTAWARRASTHPRVVAALVTEDLSESYGRTICQWTDKLPEKFRDESDELLTTAAAAGLDLRDLGALFAEMYERACGDLPDEDPERAGCAPSSASSATAASPGRTRARARALAAGRAPPPRTPPAPGKRSSRPSSARPWTCCPAPAGSPRSCAAASSGRAWAGPACPWTSGTASRSRPGSATR